MGVGVQALSGGGACFALALVAVVPQELGRNHVRYGVKAAHYEALRAAPRDRCVSLAVMCLELSHSSVVPLSVRHTKHVGWLGIERGRGPHKVSGRKPISMEISPATVAKGRPCITMNL